MRWLPRRPGSPQGARQDGRAGATANVRSVRPEASEPRGETSGHTDPHRRDAALEAAIRDAAEEAERLAASDELASALAVETARIAAEIEARAAEIEARAAAAAQSSTQHKWSTEPIQAEQIRQPAVLADAADASQPTERAAGTGPWTSADRVARARCVGMVSREEYLSPAAEAVALRGNGEGLPDARLARVRDRLLVATPAGWVNPNSRSAHKVGLHQFRLKGGSYYESALKAGRFTPGALVRLVREPDNPYDANAIAIYAERARNKAGHVPAAVAKRLAPLLDAGADLVAVSIRGANAGTDGATPRFLVCERALYDHLTRPSD